MSMPAEIVALLIFSVIFHRHFRQRKRHQTVKGCNACDIPPKFMDKNLKRLFTEQPWSNVPVKLLHAILVVLEISETLTGSMKTETTSMGTGDSNSTQFNKSKTNFLHDSCKISFVLECWSYAGLHQAMSKKPSYLTRPSYYLLLRFLISNREQH
jgi:hypothetical protein